MMAAMFGRLIAPWLLVIGLVACAQRETALPPIDPPPSGSSTGAAGSGGLGGATGTGGSGQSGSPGTGGSSGSSGSQMEAGVEGGAFDSGPDRPLVIIHQDGSGGGAACANDLTALGSNRLLAGGATPSDFTAAYNGELSASNTPGPLLLAFYGVNETNLLRWIAAVGALEPSDAGGGVGFAGPHAEVPFALASSRSLHIAPTAADFELRLVTPNGAVVLPIGSIALDGALS